MKLYARNLLIVVRECKGGIRSMIRLCKTKFDSISRTSRNQKEKASCKDTKNPQSFSLRLCVFA